MNRSGSKMFLSNSDTYEYKQKYYYIEQKEKYNARGHIAISSALIIFITSVHIPSMFTTIFTSLPLLVYGYKCLDKRDKFTSLLHNENNNCDNYQCCKCHNCK